MTSPFHQRARRAGFIPVHAGALLALALGLAGCGSKQPPVATLPPAAPIGLTATGGVGSISLGWSASTGATGYAVLRAASSNGPWSTQIATPIAASYSDSGLPPSATYFYVVRAQNEAGSSGDSAVVSATTAPPATAPPPAPAGLTATGGTQQIALTWSASAGAASYRVLRGGAHGGPYASLATPDGTSYSDAGLADGATWFYVVQATNSAGNSANSNEATATTSPVNSLPPPAPGGVTATGGAGRIDLAWTASAGAAGYQVLSGTAQGGPYGQVGTPAGTSYSDTGLADNTIRYYVIKATNAAGSSAASSEASATTLPAVPTGLTAQGGARQISLSWTASPGAGKYVVQRSSPAGSGYLQLALPITNAFVDSAGLGDGQTALYRVAARKGTADSAFSAEASATTMPAIPPAPASLGATGGSKQIALTWTASAGATGYVVSRSATSGSGYTALAAQPSGAATAFTDGNLNDGETWFYIVAAKNAGGTSASSPEASATTIPAAPLNLVATGGPGRITLTWTAATGAASYEVLRGNNTGTYTFSLTSTATTLVDAGLGDLVTQFYVVKAVNAAGKSAVSNEASATTDAAATAAPDAPGGVTANGGLAPRQVTLNWTAVGNATDYKVYRSTANDISTSTPVQGNPALPSFTDSTALNDGTTYFYAIKSHNSAGDSALSTVVNTSTLPAAPPNLLATPSGGNVGLSWDTVAGASGYQVFRATSSSAENLAGTPLSGLGPLAVTSYTDTTAQAGSSYFYVVRAVNGSGAGPASAEATTTTAPPAPTGLAASDSTAGVQLDWNAANGATGWKIFRATTSHGYGTPATGTALATLSSASPTSYLDAAAPADQGLFYVVHATGAGESGDSAEVTLHTLTAPPQNLTATNGINQITLQWDAIPSAAGSPGATQGYKVFRRTTPGSYDFATPLGTVAAGAQSTFTYNDLALASSVTFSYVVRAVNATGDSASSNEATGNTAPAVPTGLAATPGDNSTSVISVALAWTAAPGATGYQVWRGTATGSYGGAPLNSFNNAGTGPITFTDTPAASATTFFYAVKAVGPGGASGLSNEAIALTIPVAPGSLLATNGTASIGLSFTGVAGATGYRIFRASSSGGYNFGSAPAKTLGAGTGTINTSDTNAPAGAHSFYVVRATDATGDSVSSNESSAFTAPAAATLTAVPRVNAVAVDLSWTTQPGANSYQLFRTQTAGTYGAPLVTQAGTSYADNTVSSGAPYFYKVVALDTINTLTSPDSNEASALPLPATPTNLIATGAAGQINLTWTAAAGAASYRLYRSGTTNTEALFQSGLTGTAFSDPSLAAGATFFYKLEAINATGASLAQSNEASATTTPGAPIVSSTTASPTALQIDLVWSGVTGATDYTIRRSTTSGTGYVDLTPPAAKPTGTTFSDTAGLAGGTTYFYIVLANTPGGQSGASNEMSAITRPSAPALVTATGGKLLVNLSWPASTGAASYQVFRGTSAGAEGGTAIDSFNNSGTGTITRADGTALAGTTYFYKTKASNTTGQSPLSTEASDFTAPTSPAPFTATGGATSITLNWTAPALAGAGGLPADIYSVYGSDFTGGIPGGYSLIGQQPVGAATTVTETGLPAGKTRFYVVTGANRSGVSDNSAEATSTTISAAPGTLTATGGTRKVTLNWFAATGAVRYQVFRGTATNSESTTAINGAGTAGTSYSDDTPPLADGTAYFYRVESVNAGGNSGDSNEASAITAPAAAPGLAAAGGDLTVGLSWTASTGATSYDIFRSGTSGTYGAALANKATAATGTITYQDSDVALAANTQYFYVVKAKNAGGTSASSNEASADTLPATVLGLAATPSSDPSLQLKVHLTWSLPAGTANLSGYKLYRTTIPGNYTSVTPVAIAGGSTSNYDDTTVLNGTTYYYVIRASNPAGDGAANSNEASALTLPSAPTNVVATGGNGQISLTWGAVTGAATYDVYRSTNGSTGFAKVGTVSIANFTDNTSVVSTTFGTQFFYQLNATDSTGTALFSSTASAVTTPDAPATLTATGGASISLSWASAAGASGYNVYRATSSNNETLLASVTSNGHVDSTGAAGQNYFYFVRSTLGAQVSLAHSPEASAPVIPAPPSALSVSGTGDTTVSLTWTLSSGATSYDIFKSITAGSGYTLATNVSGASLPATVNGLTNGTPYFFVVQAKNASGSSGNSNEIGATPDGVPLAPTGISATAADSTVRIAWTASANATGYNVFRGTSTGNESFASALNGTTPVAASPYDDNTAANGTTYFYVVRAVNGVGSSGNSAEVSGTPSSNLQPPINVAALGLNAKVNLTWTAAPGATRYLVYRSLTTGTENYGATPLNGAAGTAGTNYTDSTASNRTPYFYTIKSTNGTPSATASAEVNATPAREVCVVVADSAAAIAVDADTPGTGTIEVPARRWFGNVTQLQGSVGVQVDTTNNEMVVLNKVGGSVTTYSISANGNAAPIRTLAGSLTTLTSTNPVALALDPVHNEIYVATNSAGVGSVVVFSRTATGNTAPLPARTISGVVPLGIAYDGANSELAVLEAASYSIYPRNTTTATHKVTGLDNKTNYPFAPGSITVDGVNPNGNVWIADTDNGFETSFYQFDRTDGAAGGSVVPPKRTLNIDSNIDNIFNVRALSFDPLLQQLVAVAAQGLVHTILEIPIPAPLGASLIATYNVITDSVAPQTHMSGSTGLAFWANGAQSRFLVASSDINAVAGYNRSDQHSPGPVTSTVPPQLVVGPNTSFDKPQAIAQDATLDQLWVTNTSVNSPGATKAYARSSATNNPTSAAVRSLPRTGSGYAGIAVDTAHGEVFVSDGVSTVSTFTSSGTSITGTGHSITALGKPKGLAFFGGELFVAESNGTGAIKVYTRLSDGTINNLARTLSDGGVNVNGPIAVAIDVINDKMIIVNNNDRSVSRFPRTAATGTAVDSHFQRPIGFGLMGVAVDPSSPVGQSNIWLSEFNSTLTHVGLGFYNVVTGGSASLLPVRTLTIPGAGKGDTSSSATAGVDFCN